MRKLLPLALLGLSAFAQVDVPFWHAMDGPAGRLIAAFAQEFNARQDRYRVLPRYQGTYEEAETKLVAALRAGSGPVLFQAELSFFPRLVAEGQALPLEAYLDLDPGFVADLFAPAWNYGVVGGGALASPSTPPPRSSSTTWTCSGRRASGPPGLAGL